MKGFILLGVLILVLILIRAHQAQAQVAILPGPKVIGYFELDDDFVKQPPSPEQINCYSRLDELVLAFFNPNKNETDDIANYFDVPPATLAMLKAIVDKAHTDSKYRCKVLMSIGGYKAKQPNRLKDLEGPDQRDHFIDMIKLFVTKYSFDGVDIDFESDDLLKENYGEFLRALKRGLWVNKTPLLTVAVASYLFEENHVELGALDSVNFVNAMSYDFGGDKFKGQR